MINKRIFVLYFIGLLSIVVATGCASTAKYLRSQPSTHFPTKTLLALPNDIQPYLKLHCISAEEIKYDDLDATNSQCLYISADASLLASASLDQTKRNSIIDTILSISDMNCSTFLHRAFANRAGFDYSKKLFQNIATATSAGTAFISPPVSAAIGGINLVVGTGIDDFNSTYYFEKTFEAMEAAIQAERAQRRALIDARKVSPTYSMVEALGDVRTYDDACSIKSGLARLIGTAENQKNLNKSAELKVQGATDATKFSTYIQEFGQ